ncbi:hypothetical protein DXG03_004009, partial [Asterophora parasitica]
MNCLADFLASHSHALSIPPLPAPLATFFMDKYTPHAANMGLFETSLSQAIDL